MEKKKVKFGVFADLHVDIMHDAQERLQVFLDACRKADVDFIIQLGDFCYPDEGRKCVCKPENRPVNIENALHIPTYADKDAILRMFNDFEKPSYYVLGNHECDMCSKEQVLAYYGADCKPYYSFDCGGFHFVVLDCNYFKKDGKYYSYCNGNYFDTDEYSERMLPYCPPEQMQWLREDLSKTKLPSILFSHEALHERDYCYSILNAADMKKIINEAPAGVWASFNGHQHVDYILREDDTWFVNINSMSCIWLDLDFIVKERYGKEIDEKYPNIQYTAPYKDPVFAIVTMDEKGCTIEGTRSEFVGIDPVEMGVYNKDSWFTHAYKGEQVTTAWQESRYLPFTKR